MTRIVLLVKDDHERDFALSTLEGMGFMWLSRAKPTHLKHTAPYGLIIYLDRKRLAFDSNIKDIEKARRAHPGSDTKVVQFEII